MIYYFDIGLHSGREVAMFIKMCNRNKWDYQIYGFEAHPSLAAKLEKKYAGNDKVHIINKAITDKPGKLKLYIAKGNNGEGNSIFSTKNNVSNKFVEVDGVPFSQWVRDTLPDFEKQYNVLRFNIEGAEWHLMHDLVEHNLHKHFNIISGANPDIPKVGELKDRLPIYNDLLKQNDIKVHRFTYVRPERNSDIEGMIKKTL